MSRASRERETLRRIAEAAALGRPRNPLPSDYRRRPRLTMVERELVWKWQKEQRDNLCGPWQPVFPPIPPRRLMYGERLVVPEQRVAEGTFVADSSELAVIAFL